MHSPYLQNIFRSPLITFESHLGYWEIYDNFLRNRQSRNSLTIHLGVGRFLKNLQGEPKELWIWFFFSVKAEIPYFTTAKSGGRSGGRSGGYFVLNVSHKIGKKRNFPTFRIKILVPLSPGASPGLHTSKVWHLSFHWKKKIKIIAFLVNF